MNRKSGFTLVEILIVVVVIAAIAGMAVMGYNSQQKSARDSKRKVDMASLVSVMDAYFNEHGTHPMTCNYGTGALSDCSSTYNELPYLTDQKSPTILPGTNITELRTIFPQLDENFKDPKSSNTAPLNRSASLIAADAYFLMSSDMANPPSTMEYNRGSFNFSDPASGGNFTCTYTIENSNSRGETANRSHRYMVGFYSETASAWKFYKSRDRRELNDISWNITNVPRCNTSDIKELSSVSSS